MYEVSGCGEQLADTTVPEPIVCDDDVAAGLGPVGRSGSRKTGKCPCAPREHYLLYDSHEVRSVLSVGNKARKA